MYNQETADKVCELLASGMSLRQIKAANPEFPAPSTICLWALSNESGFAEQYERAREIQADMLADETQDIADDLELSPEHKRVMIDVRKWRAGKQRPKKWGEKNTTVHEGEVTVTNLTAADALALAEKRSKERTNGTAQS